MKKPGRTTFALLLLVFPLLLWGCQNDSESRESGKPSGSVLVGADDQGDTSGGDHEGSGICPADSMDHGTGGMDGDSCGMGEMHGGSGGMGGMGGMGDMSGMHGEGGDSAGVHCSDGQGESDPDPGPPESDGHGGHH